MRLQKVTHSTKYVSFCVAFFKKRLGSQGEALRRSPQRAKLSCVRKAQEGELPQARGNPRRGFPFFLVLFACSFLKERTKELSYMGVAIVAVSALTRGYAQNQAFPSGEGGPLAVDEESSGVDCVCT